MDRRKFLKMSGAAMAAPGLTLAHRSARAQAAAIKIGVLAPLTGVVASGGREMVDGVNMWFEQIKFEIAGRKVELIVEDDASSRRTSPS